MKISLSRFIPFALLLFSVKAMAIPLENSFPTSAKYSGTGGAVVSHVSGPDALIHNPAGLAAEDGFHWVLNVGPSLSSRSAPITAANESVTSKLAFVPLAEAMASYSLIPGFTVGAGFSAAGGLGADYGNVAFAGYPVAPSIRTALSSVEATLGAGYQITSELSVGASWRVSYFLPGEIHTANVQTIPTIGSVLVALDGTGLSGSNYTGFRVGTQYRQKDGNWGVGLALRNAVDWKFKGNASSTVITALGAGPATPLGEVEFKYVFPIRGSLGANWKLNSLNEFFLQYDFYKYSSNQIQEVLIGGVVAQTDKLEWNDVHVFHVGYQYGVAHEWPIRLGYTLETPGLPGNRPSPATFGPAITQGFTVGTETRLGERLDLSSALIYQTSSGTGTPAPDSASFAGVYSAKSITLAGSLHW